MTPSKTTRVLLVEDNPADVSLVERYLSEEPNRPFELTHVVRLEDAAIRLSEDAFDIVLLDLSVSDSRGAFMMNQIAPSVPVVVMSHEDQKDAAHAAVQSGAQDYHIKGQDDGPHLRRALRYAIERRRSEERLAFLAQHDALTGLPNRALFRSMLNRTLTRTRRNCGLVALLLLDVDRFKLINDGFGYHVGDRLLDRFVKRVMKCVRESDVVCRMGGDEFAVILEDLRSPQDAEMIAKKILDAAGTPFDVEGSEVYVTTSIGISIYPSPESRDAETLSTAADLAMYHAKDLGRNNIQFFRPEMLTATSDRLRIDAELRHAVRRDELVLHYQPLIDVKTGHMVAAEALVRWQHPKLGLIFPGDFIPVAEDSGVIVNIGEWVMRRACRQLAEWRAMGMDEIRVAVNISGIQFRRGQLYEQIHGALKEFDIPAQFLEIELTESTLIADSLASRAILEELRSENVRVAIDDFGTGYSSLAYLKRFPLDALKIDRSFIDGLGQNPHDQAITEAIIALGRALDLQVIAEGVETLEQYEFLRDHGCDTMQGYYISRPVPAEPFAELIGRDLLPAEAKCAPSS